MAEGGEQPRTKSVRSFFGLGQSRSEQPQPVEADATPSKPQKLSKKQKKQSGAALNVVSKGIGDLVGGVFTITQRVVELGVTVGEALAAPVTDRLPKGKDITMQLPPPRTPSKPAKPQQPTTPQQEHRTRQTPKKPTKAELYPNGCFSLPFLDPLYPVIAVFTVLSYLCLKHFVSHLWALGFPVLFCRILCQYDARFCKANQAAPKTVRVAVDIDLDDVINKPPPPPPSTLEEKKDEAKPSADPAPSELVPQTNKMCGVHVLYLQKTNKQTNNKQE